MPHINADKICPNCREDMRLRASKAGDTIPEKIDLESARRFYAVKTGADCWQLYRLGWDKGPKLMRYDECGIHILIGVALVYKRLAELGEPVYPEAWK